MKIRLFIAIELPKELKEEIAVYRREIIKDLVNLPSLTTIENLHITVSFIGGVEESLIDGFIIKLKEIQTSLKPFSLQFKETILAPPGRFHSMIWVIYEKSSEYTQLTKVVNTIIVSYLKNHRHPIYLSSHQEPIPHITLARFKDKISLPDQTFPSLSVNSLDIKSITLMQSQLSSKGPKYIQIKRLSFSR